MNWFKKQMSKFINKDDNEYEYEEFYEDYEEERSEQLHSFKEAPVSKQKTFRFPLIEDEEFSAAPSTTPSKEAFNQMEDARYGQIEDLSLPKHLNNHIVDSSVYDIEVSGIRELLANRTKRTGRTTVKRSQPEQENRSKASLVFRDAQNEPPTTPTETNYSTEQTVEDSLPANRKRFVPSDVPSPVYGFAKASPIEQLLEKRKEEHDKKESEIPTASMSLKEATTNGAIENILEEKEPISTVQKDEPEQLDMPEIPEIIEAPEPITFDEKLADETSHPSDVTNTELLVPQTTSFAVEFEDQVKAAVQHELGVEQLSADQSEIHVKEVVVEQVQIENSTIHIGEVTVVQPSTNEDDEQEQSVEDVTKQEKSGIPFNVLMLKTDKEKWRVQQQFKNIKPTPALVEEAEEEQEPSSELINLEVEHQIAPTNKEEIQHFIPLENGELELDDKTAPQSTKENEVSIQNSAPINAATESVSVITMSPVATMSSVSTLEKTVIDIESYDEISATTEMKAESTTENELTTENVVIPEEDSIDAGEYQEPPSLSAETLTENQVMENPQKPVHVYQKPDDEFLELPEEKTQDTVWMEQQGDTLVEALSYFQVSAQIESIMQGPAVTQFEITVSHGTKVSKIRNLADDLKLALAAKDIRIQAPIPGKSSIGIEIPNRVSRAVRLSEVTNSASFLESDSPLEAALGLDLTGKPVTIDLRKMPHGLIAGATGSGKSVCINSILVSLLYKAAPHELKLMLIDPKMVELAPFNHIPHLVSPVITDVKAATAALKWAVEEMERRYQLFAHAGARDITRYNAIADKNNEHSLKLPYMLIVIDELADLMMMSPADVEEAICRIAQKARACGIHLIVATQRPSVDVITGLIKSNIPTRVAFAVSSQIDSRTILDGQGAERLLGRGDMLYLGNGMSAPVRLQGTFVTDDEIEAIIEHVREQGEPDYIFDQEELLKKTEVSAEQDDLFEDVCRFVYEQGGASTSLIQRKYHIGYNRAARLIDMLESHGFVSEARGSKPRESYITEEDLIAMFE
ncbi:DNA translocase FtsK [Lysinibacillus agricola]|uniref:DNA translocase FtsK n=1 Tax=Lysinibacillus agricola TaxID=2590012 RepID=A0ABX7APU3_9BACI|nr:MULTISPECIES: DNA translocase FtsK [Lysinibacillus]KOS64719.1 cell division protein [Lysinibacillus sp. FJAT-14222]QQP11811.1 DNA translocase FtsK [Lysinibacillus agricola]